MAPRELFRRPPARDDNHGNLFPVHALIRRMEPNDAELMQRVCAGEEDAFAVIVDRYKDQLVNYLTHLVRTRERAEDVAQEAFVRLYRFADRYRDHERLAPYLFRIATNHVITEMRRGERGRVLMPRPRARRPPPAPAPHAQPVAGDGAERRAERPPSLSLRGGVRTDALRRPPRL